jgi:hypothetical protein
MVEEVEEEGSSKEWTDGVEEEKKQENEDI